MAGRMNRLPWRLGQEVRAGDHSNALRYYAQPKLNLSDFPIGTPAAVIPNPVQSALDEIVPLLVAGRMEDIQRIDRGGRMKADEWRTRIAEDGKTLTRPPQGDFESSDVVPLHGKEGSAWSVWYRLWTREEGKSDLGVQLTVHHDGHTLEIEADDLRVA
jgi:hypothetical protein